MRLIILLALLIGVLYCLHLLVKDYQAITAGRVLRLLFKRDAAQNYSKPNVRWKKILQYDPLQCARTFYCGVGARTEDNDDVRSGFVYMLTLTPKEEDKHAYEEFLKAYNTGQALGANQCIKEYPICPFKPALLYSLVQNLIQHNPFSINFDPSKVKIVNNKVVISKVAANSSLF